MLDGMLYANCKCNTDGFWEIIKYMVENDLLEFKSSYLFYYDDNLFINGMNTENNTSFIEMLYSVCSNVNMYLINNGDVQIINNDNGTIKATYTDIDYEDVRTRLLGKPYTDFKDWYYDNDAGYEPLSVLQGYCYKSVYKGVYYSPVFTERMFSLPYIALVYNGNIEEARKIEVKYEVNHPLYNFKVYNFYKNGRMIDQNDYTDEVNKFVSNVNEYPTASKFVSVGLEFFWIFGKA